MYHKRNRTNKTGYLGVKWRNREQKYHAYIRVHGRKEKLYCGSAATAEEAAMLYDAKSRELYGDGAVTNFPLPNVKGVAPLLARADVETEVEL